MWEERLPFVGYSVVRRMLGVCLGTGIVFCSLTDAAERQLGPPFPGGDRRGVTPVPIPNTVVKPSTADGTARVTVWESRSLPGFIRKPEIDMVSGFALYECRDLPSQA